MKKAYYGIVIGFQGYMILISAVNLVFCFITENHNHIFFGSMYLFFIPYKRYINNNYLLDMFVLLLFFAVTILFYILSIKELFDRNNIKSPFIILNVLWIGLSYSAIIDNINNFSDYNLLPSIILLLLLIPLMLLKWREQNKYLRTKYKKEKENGLPENFQMLPKSYRQIARTAKGAPVIESGVFLVSLFFIYINILSFRFLVWLYALAVLLAVIIFVGTIVDCKKFEKRTQQKPPSNNYLAKLILTQAVSFILFILSFAMLFAIHTFLII